MCQDEEEQEALVDSTRSPSYSGILLSFFLNGLEAGKEAASANGGETDAVDQ